MLALNNLRLAGRLEDAGATFAPGQVTAICGPNGAGKSTMLAIAAGLLQADGGAAELDGQPLAALNPRLRARRIGYLPQMGDVAWNMDVRTLAALGRLPHGDAGEEAVAAALAALDLICLAARCFASLSGGEKARALLARVLAGEPDVVLADEPLASLDLAHQGALLAHFRALAEAGKAVVLVLHDLAAAMNHADRVIVLDQGRVVSNGPPQSALDPEILARVWRVRGMWLGEAGQRALSVVPL